MNQQRWLEANAVFEELIELPSDQRAIALERRCGGDSLLREAVQELLSADAAADAHQYLAGSAPLTKTLTERANRSNPASVKPPVRLGRYRVLGEIGSGGMGTIYEAVRDDDTMEQRVAIKVIRAGAENPDIIHRMGLERRILARLQHPNIARIYDADRTEEGLPYYVMERVDGLTIDEHCRRHDLGLRARLELIRKVCLAVAYANEKLIVHRDIKPSNILVTADGEPKLLDFGIAKILGPDIQRESEIPSPTEPWQQRVTLEYASPEHLRGLPVSIGCDVYSLGVLLFQLLTGEVPRSREDVMTWLYDGGPRAAELQRPSQRVSAGKDREAQLPLSASQLSRRLAGDLDSIVLAALEEDPGDRYSSAKELGDDLSRYLDGFPVQAHHGSTSYRWGKFLRRNARVVAAASVGLALSIALVASIIHSGLQAAEGRARLEVESAKREQVLDVFLGIFEQAGPLVSEGVPLSLRQAVDRYVERGDLRFVDQPDVEAAVASTLGWIHLELGDWEKAWLHHNRALMLRRGLDPADEIESMVGVAAALGGQGRLEEARLLSAEALARSSDQVTLDPRLRLRTLNTHVELLCAEGDWQAADSISGEALTLSRTLTGAKIGEVPMASSQRALVLRKLGYLKPAEELYRQTLRQLERDHGVHPLAALVHNNLASIAYRQQRWESAIEDWTRADQLFAKTYAEDYYQRAVALSNLGRALVAAGRLDEAETALRQAIQVAQESPSLGPRHEYRYFGIPAIELAELLLSSGRCGEVLDLLADRIDGWKDHKVTRQARKHVEHCRDELAREASNS